MKLDGVEIAFNNDIEIKFCCDVDIILKYYDISSMLSVIFYKEFGVMNNLRLDYLKDILTSPRSVNSRKPMFNGIVEGSFKIIFSEIGSLN